MHFARVLRGAGLPVGTGAVIDALRALAVIDVSRREDFRACLRAVLVKRHEHDELFDQAFRLFFRDPFSAEQALSLLAPKGGAQDQKPDVSRRVLDALQPSTSPRPEPPRPPPEE